MALVPGQIIQSEISASSPDLISAYVQQFLVEQAVIIPTVLDRSQDAGNNSSVDYLRTTGLTAESKAESTNYTAQKFTVASDTLSLDKQKGVYVEVETKARIQTTLNIPVETMKLSVQGLVDQLELDVYAAVRQAHANNRVKLETSSTLSLSDIFTAAKILDTAKVPQENRYFIINPTQKADIVKLNNFLDASKYGSTLGLKKGEIGEIAGFKILISNNVTVSEAVAYHMSHTVFARQYGVSFERGRNLKGSLDEYLMESYYGLKTLDLGVRGVLLNNAGAL